MDNIYHMLERHEGFRSKPYHDTVGKLTIGIGRNLDDIGLDRDEAFYLLRKDVKRVKEELAQLYPWFLALDPVRQDVMVDMGFNLGVITGNPPKLPTFKKTIRLIESGAYGEAASEMLESLWAKQVGYRANELSEMMRLGRYVGGFDPPGSTRV